MQNEAFVASLLPEHAPLSTFRVMTASRLGLSSKENTIEAISQRLPGRTQRRRDGPRLHPV